MKEYLSDAILSVLGDAEKPVTSKEISKLVWEKHREVVSSMSVGKYCRELALDGHIKRRRGKWGVIYLYER